MRTPQLEKTSKTDWWDPVSLKPGQIGKWCIGPLTLWIQREIGEWYVAFKRDTDPFAPVLDISVPVQDRTDLLDDSDTKRYVVSVESGSVQLRALLADRAIVSSSEKPLHILPNQKVTVYISSPLWVSIEVGDPPVKLTEIPIFRPSDTWFGPNSMEGELCFASKTFHRIRLDHVPVLFHRATTSVLVRNRADSPLVLERLKVPVVHLSLYYGDDGRLWTDGVIFTRSNADNFAALKTQSKADTSWAATARRLSGPRQNSNPNLMVRAFSTIFG